MPAGPQFQANSQRGPRPDFCLLETSHNCTVFSTWTCHPKALTEEVESLRGFSGQRDAANAQIAALEAANEELRDQQEMRVSLHGRTDRAEAKQRWVLCASRGLHFWSSARSLGVALRRNVFFLGGQQPHSIFDLEVICRGAQLRRAMPQGKGVFGTQRGTKSSTILRWHGNSGQDHVARLVKTNP